MGDPWTPDYRKNKKLAETSVFETDLRAGDLLYIPGGSPHAVQNLEDNLGLSMNYLDLKTFPSFARACNAGGGMLCSFLKGKGEWLIEALLEKRALTKSLDYMKFAGFSTDAEFCEAHKGTRES